MYQQISFRGHNELTLLDVAAFFSAQHDMHDSDTGRGEETVFALIGAVLVEIIVLYGSLHCRKSYINNVKQ